MVEDPFSPGFHLAVLLQHPSVRDISVPPVMYDLLYREVDLPHLSMHQSVAMLSVRECCWIRVP